MSWFELAPKGAVPLDSRSPSKPRRRLSGEATQALVCLVDIGLVWLSATISRAMWIGDGFILDSSGGSLVIATTSSLLFAGWVGIRRGYSLPPIGGLGHQLRIVVEGWVLAFFVLGWIGFLVRVYDDFSRGLITLHFVVGLALLLLAHAIGSRWLAHALASGGVSLRRVSVFCVAEANETEAIRREMVGGGIEVASITAILPDVAAVAFPRLCREAADDVRSALADDGIDGVYLFFPWRRRGLIETLQSALGPLPVPIYLFADRETAALLGRAERRVGALRGFEFQRAPLNRFDRMVKRALDLGIAVVAIVLSAPIMGMAAAAILLESGRPVLFRQTRKGFGARPFRILKFRSMTVQEDGAVVRQATRGDARVTRLGRFLRRTSIDELPQLFNVLRGDMSIVGPRPHALAHDDYYDGLLASYAHRQHVKPGITGWAQVNGHRGETREIGQMSARVEHDLWYIENWSIWLDIRIVCRTALRIFNDDRAY